MIKTVDYKFRKYFSEYVTYAMEERDIRPWYVAYYSEMQDSAFRKCLKAARLPNITSLIMMAELFECTVNDLLGYEHVHIEFGDHIFDSGLDSKRVGEYFSHQLERYMANRKVSVSELAKACECTDSTIVKYMCENVIPDTSILLQICSALDCTPSELLGY